MSRTAEELIRIRKEKWESGCGIEYDRQLRQAILPAVFLPETKKSASRKGCTFVVL